MLIWAHFGLISFSGEREKTIFQSVKLLRHRWSSGAFLPRPSFFREHEHSFGQDIQRPGELRTIIVVVVTATMMVVEIRAGIPSGSTVEVRRCVHENELNETHSRREKLDIPVGVKKVQVRRIQQG
jgi:hypothetical protein